MTSESDRTVAAGSDDATGEGLRAPQLGADALRALFTALPDGVVVADRNGSILHVNDQLLEQFGYERDELLGRPVDELLPLDQRSAHRDHRRGFVAEPRTRPMGAGLELWGRRRDGDVFPVEIALGHYGADDSLIVVAAVRDVTTRRADERRLRTLLHLVDNVREGVIVLDAKTNQITYANSGAAHLAGYSREELVTMTPADVLPALGESRRFDSPAVVDGIAAAFSQEVVLCRRDGAEIPVEVMVSLPYSDERDEHAVFAIVHDIRERRAREADQRATLELEARLADRERIARDLHDTVIQELFGVGLGLQAAAGQCDGPLRDKILDAVDSQDQIIRDIRMAIFGMTVHHRNHDELLDQALVVVAESERVLGFRPAFRAEGPLNTVIPPDVTKQLIPTLRELLSNAARHSAAARVEIDLSCSGSEVKLVVSDNGNGIADRSQAGNGLANLASRAGQLGGRFTIGAAPDGGTRAEWVVPLDG